MWSPTHLAVNELFCINTVPPLPCIDDPEDQRQHYSSRYQNQSNINQFTICLQARTVIVADVCECFPHKSAVLQINQKWTIVIQPIAYIHCSFHLPVNRRRHPTGRLANAWRGNLTGIVLPHLFQTTFHQPIFFREYSEKHDLMNACVVRGWLIITKKRLSGYFERNRHDWVRPTDYPIPMDFNQRLVLL